MDDRYTDPKENPLIRVDPPDQDTDETPGDGVVPFPPPHMEPEKKTKAKADRYTVVDVGRVSGIALSSSSVDDPGFEDGRLIGETGGPEGELEKKAAAALRERNGLGLYLDNSVFLEFKDGRPILKNYISETETALDRLNPELELRLKEVLDE